MNSLRQIQSIKNGKRKTRQAVYILLAGAFAVLCAVFPDTPSVSAAKKHESDAAAIRKILKKQRDSGADISKKLDNLNDRDYYIWKAVGKEQRLVEVNWKGEGLSGKISFAGLPKLKRLDCSKNRLSGIVSSNPALLTLNCSGNRLERAVIKSELLLSVYCDKQEDIQAGAPYGDVVIIRY